MIRNRETYALQVNNEGSEWKVSIVPESKLFYALKKTTVNFPKKSKKILNKEALSLEQIANVFHSIIKHLDSFLDPENTAKDISDSLNVLIQFTEKASNQLEKTIDQAKKMLLLTVDKETEITQTLQTTISYKKLTGLKLNKIIAYQSSLENEILEKSNEINFLKNRIKEEGVNRKNAWLDLIPFYGMIDGIMKGELERMIPLYSSIKGIDSVIWNKKERAEQKIISNNYYLKNLNKSKDDLNDVIYVETRKFKKINLNEEELSLAIDLNDLQLKSRGKQLTDLQEIKQYIQKVIQQYKRLQGDFEIQVIESSKLDSKTKIKYLESGLQFYNLKK